MVKVKVRRDARGAINGFHITGHARYADHGSDIVCAGVSAVAQTAVLGLRQVAGIPVQVDEGPGKLDCTVLEFTQSGAQPNPGETAEAVRQKAQAILEAMVVGLRDIEKDYPKHVRVSET
jgi:uncharacterized protein YsxB (DUF464 family)